MNEQEIFYNHQAEVQVLGSMIENPKIIPEIVAELGENGFYNQRHQLIYDAIVALSDSDTLDEKVIANYLKSVNELNRVGGEEAIAEIIWATPTSENYQYYVETLKEKTFRRKLRQVGQNLTLLSQNADEGITRDELMMGAETHVAKLQQHETGDSMLISDVAVPVIDEMINRQERKKMISTGFVSFDNLTGGWHEGNLDLIASRPGVGKTTLALQMAHWQTYYKHNPVLFISYEMRKEALLLRLLSLETGISFRRLETEVLSDEEKQQVYGMQEKLQETPLYIMDEQKKLSELPSYVKYMRNRYGIIAAIVDYLQIIPTSKEVSRYELVTECSSTLKTIAMNNSIPVIALSQLSRAIERRQDSAPVLSDLRESGSLEQDADLVAFLQREDEFSAEDNMTTYLIIKKQRNGPQGTIELKLIPERFRFEEI